MHRPRQRIQLQLSTRIFGQSMRNWWAVFSCYFSIVYQLENLYMRLWSCMFIYCCFSFLKKRLICIYNFLSQVSVHWSLCSKEPSVKVGFCLFFLFAIYLWLLFPSDINECESSPCLNNGACTDRINAFSCSCPPGFSGNRCEIGQDSVKLITL